MSVIAMELSESQVTEVRQLVSQVRRVQRAHRAGITPHYGELENLFETAGAVERALDAQTPAVRVDKCAVEDCDGIAARELSTGRKLCARCHTAYVTLVGVGERL